MKKLKLNEISLSAALASAFISLILLSNILSVKIISLLGLAMDAGTLLYPLTFAVKDIIQKKFGRKAARTTIWTSYGIMAFAFAVFWIVSKMPPDTSWGNNEAFVMTLAPMGRLVVASITAGLLSELLDTAVFSKLWARFNQLWVSFVSNSVGLVLDSVVFAVIAFAGVLPNDVVLQIILANFLVKLAISVIALPSILTVKPTKKELI